MSPVSLLLSAIGAGMDDKVGSRPMVAVGVFILAAGLVVLGAAEPARGHRPSRRRPRRGRAPPGRVGAWPADPAAEVGDFGSPREPPTSAVSGGSGGPPLTRTRANLLTPTL